MNQRCDELLLEVTRTGKELENHLITDEVGDIYPADTAEAREALERSMEAFYAWSEECSE